MKKKNSNKKRKTEKEPDLMEDDNASEELEAFEASEPDPGEGLC